MTRMKPDSEVASGLEEIVSKYNRLGKKIRQALNKCGIVIATPLNKLGLFGRQIGELDHSLLFIELPPAAAEDALKTMEKEREMQLEFHKEKSADITAVRRTSERLGHGRE